MKAYSPEQTKAIFRTLKAEADAAAKAAARDGQQPVALRMHGTTDASGRPTVDYSKADRGCLYCGGTGQRPSKKFADEQTGETMIIPVVCRCVKRNGGVAEDLLDRIQRGVARSQATPLDDIGKGEN